MQLATTSAVDELVHSAATEFGSDRRKNRRFPFFRPVTIEIDGATITAFSRDISSSSIGLLHSVPIEPAFAKIRVPTTRRREIEVMSEVQWCEPHHDGWYLSGARFSGTSVWRVPSLLLAVVASETHRRFNQRYPVFRAAKIVTADTIVNGFTKDISAEGVGLLHDRPLTTERVLLKLAGDARRPVDIQTDIKWCKSCHDGWFVSGGRFAGLSFAELPELLS